MQRAERRGSRRRGPLASASSAANARPGAVRGERELEQALLAPGRLADRAPASPRRPPTRPRRAARARARSRRGRAAAARQAQARPMTPPPTTTTSALGVVGALCATGAAPCPGRRTFASPCAGITRIRFRRSAARRRPLSPLGRAPVAFKILPVHGRDETARSIERFFAAFGDGDLDAALALTTEDVVLDRSRLEGAVPRGRPRVTTRSAWPTPSSATRSGR